MQDWLVRRTLPEVQSGYRELDIPILDTTGRQADILLLEV